MSDLLLTCPECGNEFELTDSIAAPLLENAQREFERKIQLKDKEIARQKKEMDERNVALEQAEASLDEIITQRLGEERTKIATSEAKKAKAKFQSELESKNEALEETRLLLESTQKSLTASKKIEAEFVKKKRELEEEKRSLELSVQEKVDEELRLSRPKLKQEVEAEAKLKLREKDIQLESMKAEIESLKRKSDQGSQQIQGEAYEQEISDILASKFPRDTFRRVKKGQSGADCVHEVYNAQGKLCGTILWESKRTKDWKDAWLSKLKDDQHAAKADVAIIVSRDLPDGIELFGQLEEIWVAGFGCVVPMAASLRHLLIEVFSTKRANEGHQDKAALIYSYVTSVAFRQRVKAMTETFASMQDDLHKEQIAIKKQWAKRESQLERIIDATTGMYGDLQGIAGQSIPELEGIGFDSLGPGE